MRLRTAWSLDHRPASQTQSPLSCALSPRHLVLPSQSSELLSPGPGQATQLKSSWDVQQTGPSPPGLDTLPNNPGAVASPIDHRDLRGSSSPEPPNPPQGSQPRRPPRSQQGPAVGRDALSSAGGKGSGHRSEPGGSHRRESDLKRGVFGHFQVFLARHFTLSYLSCQLES